MIRMGEKTLVVATLPDCPKGLEFEEFISAFMQCSGRYIERDLHERNPQDICELDISATEHNQDQGQVFVVEVKSGKWGLNDLFTLRGKADFLGVRDVAMVTLGACDAAEHFQYVAERMGIQWFCVESHDQAETVLARYLGSSECDPIDAEVWRYSYWLERALVDQLSELKKTGSGRSGPGVVWRYYQSLQTNMFQLDMLTRTEALYRSFRENCHLSAKWAAEISGGDWDGDHRSIANDIYQEVYYRSGAHELNLPLFVEAKARLSILKNLVDYELYRRSHTEDDVNALVCSFGEYQVHFLDMLPTSFKQALELLRQRPFFHRYAVLWQWFLWLFGGFILLDHEEQEYEHLARVSGMPRECVPEALQAFDVLFPISTGSWFQNLGERSRIRVLKLSPVPFHGIGAFYRRCLYTEDGDLDNLNLAGAFTMNDLARWNNCGLAYLSNR